MPNAEDSRRSAEELRERRFCEDLGVSVAAEGDGGSRITHADGHGNGGGSLQHSDDLGEISCFSAAGRAAVPHLALGYILPVLGAMLAWRAHL